MAIRMSMPNVPLSSANRVASVPPEVAIKALVSMLEQGNGQTLVLTGAGISVDSGIRAYRGEHGSYTVHKTYRPIFYHEFVASHTARQRYWARSYLGYPPVRVAEPNPSHYAVAALKRLGYISSIITQNVDRLHHKAFPSTQKAASNILELHGSLKHVVCLNCKNVTDRDVFQDTLSEMNPDWADYAREVVLKGIEPKSNPDGDVDLQDRSYDSYKLPSCTSCGKGPLKPAVIFFGENIPDSAKEATNRMIEQASGLLIIGSSLATYSAFRLVKQAVERQIPVSLLSIGPSRADLLIKPELRFDLAASSILRPVGLQLASTSNDAMALQMLRSGKIKATSKVHPAS